MRFIFIFCLFVTACAHQSPAPESSPSFVYDGHGAQSIPESILEAYAPGPLPQDLTLQLESLLDLRSPSAGIITEDGRTLVFNWNVTGTSHIWLRNLRDGFPVQLTGGAQSARLVGLSPDGENLYFMRDREGDEFFGLYEMPLTGGAAQVIFSEPRVSAGLQHIDPNGRFLYYYANNISPRDYALYRFDLETRESTLLLSEPGFWRLVDKGGDNQLLVLRLKSNTAQEYFLLNEENLSLTPLLGQEEEEDYQVAFGTREEEFLVRTNRFGEFHRLYRYNARDRSFSVVTDDIPHDVTSMRIDNQKQRLLYGYNENGYIRPRARSLPDLSPINLDFLNRDDIENVYWGSTTLNGHYTGVALDVYHSPQETLLIDWRDMSTRPLSLASTPEIDTRGFTRAQLETYETRDGVKIPMLVNRPAHCENTVCPVVVNFHGGPESQQRAGFSPRVQAFVDAGFIYVRPNVRGSRGLGKTWLDSDNGPRRLDVISDIADVGLYIKNNWSRDGVTPRVGVMGGSYGGYSTYMAMTKFAGVYEAGVSSVGMSSLVSFLKNTADYRRALRESEYGSLEHDREALIKLSPITYLDRLKDPLMILHGATDPRVPAGEAVQIKQLMDERGIEGELILFADEGHGIRRRPNQVMGLGHTLRFFREHLMN